MSIEGKFTPGMGSSKSYSIAKEIGVKEWFGLPKTSASIQVVRLLRLPQEIGSGSGSSARQNGKVPISQTTTINLCLTQNAWEEVALNVPCLRGWQRQHLGAQCGVVCGRCFLGR